LCASTGRANPQFVPPEVFRKLEGRDEGATFPKASRRVGSTNNGDVYFLYTTRPHHQACYLLQGLKGVRFWHLCPFGVQEANALKGTLKHEVRFAILLIAVEPQGPFWRVPRSAPVLGTLLQ
jgi:hypothetical protein